MIVASTTGVAIGEVAGVVGGVKGLASPLSGLLWVGMLSTWCCPGI